MAIETEFTPLASAAGGVLIGIAAVLMMLLNGRIAGISNILARTIHPGPGAKPFESLAFLIGLIAAPLLWQLLSGHPIAQNVTTALPLAAIAGLLVGFGAVTGGGCTSGHGVCGLARISGRSIVATLVFMTTAILIVFVTRHIIGATA